MRQQLRELVEEIDASARSRACPCRGSSPASSGSGSGSSLEKQSRQQWQQQLDPELAFVEGVVLSAVVVTVVGSTPPQCKGIQVMDRGQ